MKSLIIWLSLFLGLVFTTPNSVFGKSGADSVYPQTDPKPKPKKSHGLFPNGVLGANGVAAVNNINDTLGKNLSSIQKHLFNYLKDSLNLTINKTVIGLIDSAIIRLGDPKNQKSLNTLLDGLIKNSVGSTRVELTTFKNNLLDDKFRDQLSKTLTLVMNDVVEKPSARLVDIVTGDNTRVHLDRLLRMIVPALLNDSALGQVDGLRNTLLGDDMKRSINGILDTALGTVNARLKHDIVPNLQAAIKADTDSINQKGKDVILYISIAVLVIGLIFYYLHTRIIKKKNDLLFTVSNTIEEFREADATPGQEIFHSLTEMIRKNMVRAQLETDMKNFLIQKSINKPTDYTK